MLQNNVNRLLLNFICMISVNVLNLKLSILCWVFSLLWYATWYMYMQCLQWKILGIWIKISELSLAVISFLLTFLYLYQAYHKIVIIDIIKNHYLSQFKDAQSKMQQYRKMETESWYTMTLLNISDIFCPWNICRSFPLYNRYMYVICHFH